jgi:hypothetical protein
VSQGSRFSADLEEKICIIRSHQSDFQFWNEIWQIHVAILFVEGGSGSGGGSSFKKDKACCYQRKLKVSTTIKKK